MSRGSSRPRRPAYSGSMLRRRTRFIWALIAVVAMVGSSLAEFARACPPIPAFSAAPAVSPCTGDPATANCCLSPCGIQQYLPASPSTTSDVKAVPARAIRVNVADRGMATAAMDRRAHLPPERPPSVRFSVLRL